MDRIKCAVWDSDVLLMEKYGLKHKMGHQSLARWGSVVKPLWDVILEGTLPFVSSHSGFEGTKMLQLFC